MPTGGTNSQGTQNTPGSHGFFRAPTWSTTGWGFQNRNGQIAFDVNAPGRNNHTIAAPRGYGTPTPVGMPSRDAKSLLQGLGARYELSNRLLPIKSQIARLTAGGNGFKTYGLYNSYAKQANTDFGHAVDQQYGNLAGRGFLNSGVADRSAQSMAQQHSMQLDELSRQYGKKAVGDLRADMGVARQGFSNDVMQLLLSAYKNQQQLNTLGG